MTSHETSHETSGAMVTPDYDGIQELDNPLPPWWKWVFIGTVPFSFLYFGFYHFGAAGRGIEDRYATRSAEIARAQFAEIGELKPDRATLVRFMNQPRWLVIGRSVYQTHCASCHGNDGGGIVGPNLTDNHYKNVREIEDVVRVINNGAGAGAMPAWQGRLEENERIMVASYVASFRGTSPAGAAKASEGREIAPWPTLEQIQAEQAAADQALSDQAAKEEAGKEEAAGEGGQNRDSGEGSQSSAG